MNIIATTCNTTTDYESRKKEYETSFSAILKLGVNKVYLVENNCNGNINYFLKYPFSYELTAFENPNKGISEFLSIKEVILKYNIKNFIKLTGRYELIDNTLFEEAGNFDFVGSLDGNMYPGDKGIHTFYFYIKSKLFLEFMEQLDLTMTDPIEWKFKEFIINKPNTKLINYLGVFAKPYYNKNLWRIV